MAMTQSFRLNSILEEQRAELEKLSTALSLSRSNDSPSNLDDIVGNLTSINRSIRQLHENLVECEVGAELTDPALNFVNKHQNVTRRKPIVTYQPTPIEQLKKMRRVKDVSHNIIEWQSVSVKAQCDNDHCVNIVTNDISCATLTNVHSREQVEQLSSTNTKSETCVVGLNSLIDDFLTVHSTATEGTRSSAKLKKTTSNNDSFSQNLSNSNSSFENSRKRPPLNVDEELESVSQEKKKKVSRSHKLTEIDLFASTTAGSSPSMVSADRSASRKVSEIVCEPKLDEFIVEKAPQEPKIRLAYCPKEVYLSLGQQASDSKRVDGRMPITRANRLTPQEQLKMRYEQTQKEKEKVAQPHPPAPSSTIEHEELDKNPAELKESHLGNQLSMNKTVICTVRPGNKRMAHVSSIQNVSASRRPCIPIDIGSKIPTAVRQRYLNIFIDECLKCFESEQTAYEVALEQESSVFQKSGSKSAYLNAAVNAIKRIRDGLGVGHPTSTQSKESNNEKSVFGLSHSDAIQGKAKSCITLRRSAAASHSMETFGDSDGDEFYERMSKYILSDSELDKFGYPRNDSSCPGRAVFKNDACSKLYVSIEDCFPETKRICCRCGSAFHITFNADTATYEYNGSTECIHHWGKAWKRRVSGIIESRYTCCQGDLDSKGCCLAKYHVTDTSAVRALERYVTTKSSKIYLRMMHNKSRVFAVDCEMVYTTAGTELARVTVVDSTFRVVYDKIVKPDHQLLDCNSRFSGLSEKDVINAQMSLHQVQTELLDLFDQSTILVGHSLEGDMKALKIIHDKIVDSSVVFPHKMGLPHKRALKTLALEYLEKIIQNAVDGHDSKEDAEICMQLMKWKLRNEASFRK